MRGDDSANNPYRAPDAPVGDFSREDTTPAPPRPRAVVFTIIIGWLFLALGVYAAARATGWFVADWDVYSHVGSAYIRVAWRAALVAYALAMLISLHRRRPLGRWLGALFIATIGAYFVYLIFLARPPGGTFAYRVGAYTGGLLLFVAPTAWWLYTFTLSRKARAWFNWVPGPDAPR